MKRSTSRASLLLRLLPFPLALCAAIAGCGGKVVVDGDGTGGGGGAGGGSSNNGSTGAVLPPSTGAAGPFTCEAAITHVEQCVPGSIGSAGGIPMSLCSGMVLCQATCLLSAPCAAFTGLDQAATQAFADCVNACGK